MAAEQSMTQAITQAVTEATKAAIMQSEKLKIQPAMQEQ